MKSHINHFVLIASIFVFPFANASEITDTYSSGDTLTTSTLDNIKNAVNDNDQRIDSLESSDSAMQDFSDYTLNFSALSSPKNVVVLKSINSDGSAYYSVRSAYANSTEEVSVQGAMTIPSFIFKFISVGTDVDGNITNIYTSVDALDQASIYTDHTQESSSYSVPSLVKTVDNDITSIQYNCGDSAASVFVCEYTRYNSGTPASHSYVTSVRHSLGSSEINGLNFDDLIGVNMTSGSNMGYSVRAKGLGVLLQFGVNSGHSVVIYYRVDGSSDGSLDGSPFGSGALLENFFF